jgi:hypothetical protein
MAEPEEEMATGFEDKWLIPKSTAYVKQIAVSHQLAEYHWYNSPTSA